MGFGRRRALYCLRLLWLLFQNAGEQAVEFVFINLHESFVAQLRGTVAKPRLISSAHKLVFFCGKLVREFACFCPVLAGISAAVRV